jgi:hypothetical protein
MTERTAANRGPRKGSLGRKGGGRAPRSPTRWLILTRLARLDEARTLIAELRARIGDLTRPSSCMPTNPSC